MFVETKREGEAAVQVKPSLSGFIAWLETQDPAQVYDWVNVRGCAVCQYYDAIGINDFASRKRPLYHETFDVTRPGAGHRYHQVCKTEPWTFGAALARARELADK